VVPLLRAEGGEEESQVGLVVPEDIRATEAETMILPRTPDEALVVDVARGLDSGSMIEQAYCILMQVPCSVGYHREEGNVEGVVWACVLAILSVGPRFQCPAPSRRAGLGVRVLPGDIEDELATRWPMTLAMWPYSGSLRQMSPCSRWAPVSPVSTTACLGMSPLSVMEVTPVRSRKMR